VVPRMLNKQAAGELGIVEKRSQCIEPGSWRKMRAGSLTGLVQLADKAGVIAVTF
jgi:FixJ family two-component response regulator